MKTKLNDNEVKEIVKMQHYAYLSIVDLKST